MTWADWAIIAVLGLSALISVVRGFVKEVISLLIWVAAAVVASIFHDQLAVWMVGLITTPSLRLLTAWVVLFVVVLIIGGILNYLLGKLVEATGLSGTDRLMGILFGLARGFIILMMMVILLPNVLPVDQDLWWQKSKLIPYFLQYEGWARDTGAAVVDFLKNLL
ncbi:MAG: membrane protein required for colicin V production [Porticoccus sp.]|jgi:membrane protein required for colicin V production